MEFEFKQAESFSNNIASTLCQESKGGWVLLPHNGIVNNGDGTFLLIFSRWLGDKK